MKRILKSILQKTTLLAIGFVAVQMNPVMASDLNTNNVSENKPVVEESAAVAQNRPIAIIRRFKPDVFVSSNGEWKPARMGQQLFGPDTVRTSENGFAVIQFMDNSVAKLGPNSTLIVNGQITSTGTTAARLAMEMGSVLMEVSGRNSDYELATPTAVAAVKGTVYGTEVDNSGNSTFSCAEGLVEITNSAGEVVSCAAGTQVGVNQDGQMSSQAMSMEDLAALLNQYQEQEDEATQQQGQQTEVQVRKITITIKKGDEEFTYEIEYVEVSEEEEESDDGDN